MVVVYAWYDSNGQSIPYVGEAWWQDAMSQDYVITRDQLPSFK